jgi:hypothetical protein
MEQGTKMYAEVGTTHASEFKVSRAASPQITVII